MEQRKIMSLSEVQLKTVQDILSEAQDNMDNLTEWEQQFVDDMTEKLEEFGEDLVVSDKQWEILNRIEMKV